MSDTPIRRDRLVSYALDHCRVETYYCWMHRHDRGDFRCDSRVLPDHNLIYITHGRAVWRVENQEQTISPGDLLVVPKGVRHEARTVTKRVRILSLHVIPRLPGQRDAFELLRPPLARHAAAGSHLRGYLDDAAAEFDRDYTPDAIRTMPGWTRLIVGEVLRDDADAGRLAPRAVDPLVDALLEALHKRVAVPTTLGDLAALAGYSAQHVNRVFGHVLGTTPLRYLTRLRIERARDLLLENHLTVATVAERVGYDDPYYFSRAFKQHVGVSPSEYRDQIGSENPF